MITVEASAFSFPFEVPVRLLVGDVEGGSGVLTLASVRGAVPDWRAPLAALLREWADDIESNGSDDEEADDAPA